MPEIRSSAELRNKYNEISDFCHSYNEPVFITKNGKGDIAVMSIETYEEIQSKAELYSKLLAGIDDIRHGRSKTFDEALSEIEAKRSK